MIYKSTNWGSKGLWLDQEQSVTFATNKFLIISAQQTLVLFGGSVTSGDTKTKNK